MSRNFTSVKVFLELPKKDFVQLKNGIKILLFTVGLSFSAPSYGHSDVNPVQSTETRVVDNLSISLVDNDLSLVPETSYQTEYDLFSSLQIHRSEQMQPGDMDDFWTVAKEIAWLDFTDSMVCYEPEDRQITYDILDKSGLVLHITQYMDKPKDQVVFSIEKDTRFLIAGHTPIQNLGHKLQLVVDDLQKDNG
jgi:hypothetical protein